MTGNVTEAAPRRVFLPRPPEPAPRHPFPLLASLAPVVGSLVIWAITSSPFALVFAFLGPVIAVGTMADGRLHGRRRLAKDRVLFAHDLTVARGAIEAAHLAETQEMDAAHPSALALLVAPERDPERWRRGFDEPVEVVIGWGLQASALRIDGGDPVELSDLVAAALTVRAPVVVDARLGIGIVGKPVACWAVARGLALQLANLLPPEKAQWSASGSEADWLRALPHSQAVDASPGQSPLGEFHWRDQSGRAVITVAARSTDLPHGHRVVISVGGSEGAVLVSHPERRVPLQLETESVSLAQAAAIAERLSRCATGRSAGSGTLPMSLSLSSCASPSASGTGATAGVLEARFMVGIGGVVPIDLVVDGPHAVVGGTTGSGKSELLLSWLLAIALHSSPEQVNFLLVDFKGGASFGPIVGLPHVVGLVTDLDERSAHRALSSLRAEVRFRERTLAAAGARSIEELSAISRLRRLVIVVDEFAALVAGFPELHELFSDLAARGRSLGVHLVLCTQRPAGVVRDSVLANVPLRVSLRVNNRADSTAVIGTDAAAVLPTNPPGRAIVAFAGADPISTQVALADGEDFARAVALFGGSQRPRRPWCDDLPALIAPELLEQPHDGYAIGLLDLPDEQRQATATWIPASDGNLMVIGGPASGKSAFIALLEGRGGEQACAGIEGGWDAVSAAVDSIRRGEARPRVILIDDLDSLVSQFSDDYDLAFIDALAELLRTGGAAGIHVVLTARRVSTRIQTIVSSCDSKLLLRHSNRQDYLLSGGERSLFSPESIAGRGEWHGAIVQLAWAEPSIPGDLGMVAPFSPTGTTLVVSSRPGEFAARYPSCRVVELRAGYAPGPGDGTEFEVSSANQPTLVVGDPDSWQANWSHLVALRSTATMIFDRSTVSDFRTFSATRPLPPPLASHSSNGWKLEPGRPATRVGLAG